jgi:hypothetical protein
MNGFRVTAAVLALWVTVAATLQAQDEPELRGTVVSAETGEKVAGAWIALEGYDWGTYSWNDGHFWLPEIPGGAARYEVSAVGYESDVLTLDPAGSDLVVQLRPVPEVLDGMPFLMEQLEGRRNRGGDLRVFDREALAFHGYFDLRDFLSQHGVRGVRAVCLDERPEAIGILDREGHGFYMAEVVGGYLRLYTDEFIERAARERLELQREPYVCSGPVKGEAD